jgi:hypothetical protein
MCGIENGRKGWLFFGQENYTLFGQWLRVTVKCALTRDPMNAHNARARIGGSMQYNADVFTIDGGMLVGWQP